MNIGTGKGTSVLEMIDLVCDVTNKEIPYMITERRKGDLPTVYCSPEYVHKKLGWKSKRDIRESILNGWKFLQQQ